MNATAILGGLGSLLFIVSIVVFAIGSIRPQTAARESPTTASPPQAPKPENPTEK